MSNLKTILWIGGMLLIGGAVNAIADECGNFESPGMAAAIAEECTEHEDSVMNARKMAYMFTQWSPAADELDKIIKHGGRESAREVVRDVLWRTAHDKLHCRGLKDILNQRVEDPAFGPVLVPRIVYLKSSMNQFHTQQVRKCFLRKIITPLERVASGSEKECFSILKMAEHWSASFEYHCWLAREKFRTLHNLPGSYLEKVQDDILILGRDPKVSEEKTNRKPEGKIDDGAARKGTRAPSAK